MKHLFLTQGLKRRKLPCSLALGLDRVPATLLCSRPSPHLQRASLRRTPELDLKTTKTSAKSANKGSYHTSKCSLAGAVGDGLAGLSLQPCVSDTKQLENITPTGARRPCPIQQACGTVRPGQPHPHPHTGCSGQGPKGYKTGFPLCLQPLCPPRMSSLRNPPATPIPCPST